MELHRFPNQSYKNYIQSKELKGIKEAKLLQNLPTRNKNQT
jgi:hypothetical protein